MPSVCVRRSVKVVVVDERRLSTDFPRARLSIFSTLSLSRVSACALRLVRNIWYAYYHYHMTIAMLIIWRIIEVLLLAESYAYAFALENPSRSKFVRNNSNNNNNNNNKPEQSVWSIMKSKLKNNKTSDLLTIVIYYLIFFCIKSRNRAQ